MAADRKVYSRSINIVTYIVIYIIIPLNKYALPY